MATAAAAVNQSQNQRENQTTSADPSGKTRTLARSVVGQAKEAALRIPHDFQRGLVLDRIGAAEATLDDLNAAVDTANRAYPHRMATLTAIGEQLAISQGAPEAIGSKLTEGGDSTLLAVIADRKTQKGNVVEALRISDRIQSPEVRSGALESIARRQAANGDYVGAEKTLALARAAHRADRSSPDEAEMMIAEAQISRGEAQAARKTLASIGSAEMRSAVMISGAGELLKKGDRANASAWVADALQGLPAGPASDFIRYIAIPLQVRLGERERATQAADALSSDLRVKGHAAVAVACVEAKDVPGVNGALEKMRLAASSVTEEKELSKFGAKLNLLNVSAALIDNDELDAASRLLVAVEQGLDEMERSLIEPKARLQQVVVKAHQGSFDAARSQALKMRPNSVSDVERGTALRAITLLQTKKSGATSVQRWALALSDSEDRAYALLGIAEALLGSSDVKLGYGTIQVH